MSTRLRRRLPSTRPTSVTHALDLLGIGHYYNFKGEPKHSTRPLQLMARCPFHHDRKASFSIREDDGTWYCFACLTGGSLAWLAARACRAPLFLAKKWAAGIEPEWEPGEVVDPEYDTYDDNWFFAKYPSPPGWALKERGISAEAAADLSIGWRDYDDAWVLPVRHPDTFNLLGWQVKSPDAVRTEAGTPKSHTLFGIDIFRPGTTAILVEDALDVARLLTVGVKGAVASFGAGVSRTQLQLLADRASKIVLALDNDDAGRKGTKKAVDSEQLAGKELYLFDYEHAPDVKDPGELSAHEIWQGLRTAKGINR